MLRSKMLKEGMYMEMLDDRCLFCKIIKKEIKSDIVYEDEGTFAINDVNPQAPVHILILPKKHIPSLLDLKEEDSALMYNVYQTIKRIASEKKIDKDGFRVIINCNSWGGQTVFHLHFHLLGGRVMRWPPG